MIRINESLYIDERELSFTYARSPGPGGQNVNKVATRVMLRFDVANSPSLSAHQKDRLREAIATRLSKAGVLRLVCSRYRTQAANRRAVVEKFVVLLAGVLRPRKPRRQTKPTRTSRRRRLEQKRRRSRLKEQRRRVELDDA